MTALSPTIVFSGAGGGVPDLSLFRTEIEGKHAFEVIGYPGWARYVSDGFTIGALIADLSVVVAAKVPRGPIRIIGVSLGGHFGYAVALHLQASGREIAGLCAIDTFMISSAAPSSGWTRRVAARTSRLLRNRRIGELGRFLRSLFWRALLRTAGRRLPNLLHAYHRSGRLPRLLAFDPMFERELSMRLLLRETVPWLAALDRDPIPLKAPAILLRTCSNADDDAAWRRRCPGIKIIDIPGDHQTIFDSDHSRSLREAYIAATPDWR